jgi:hypothetical protein
MAGIKYPETVAFVTKVREFKKREQERAHTIVRKVLFEMARDIAYLSPVDSGRFRANWQFTWDAPGTGTTESCLPDAGATAYGMQSKIPVEAAGRVYFFANNLDYAVPLEYGYSQQAPAGILSQVHARAERYLREATR